MSKHIFEYTKVHPIVLVVTQQYILAVRTQMKGVYIYTCIYLYIYTHIYTYACIQVHPMIWSSLPKLSHHPTPRRELGGVESCRPYASLVGLRVIRRRTLRNYFLGADCGLDP